MRKGDRIICLIIFSERGLSEPEFIELKNDPNFRILLIQQIR